MKRKIIKINRRPTLYAALFVVFFLLMAIEDLFSKVLPSFFSYIDDAYAAIAMIGIVLYGIVAKRLAKPILLLGICAGIGLLSNFLYQIQPSKTAILIDILIFFKVYASLFCVIHLFSKKDAAQTLNYLTMLSKMMLILLTVLAFVSVFIPRMNDKFGNFQFFGQFTGTVAFWVIIFEAIISWNPNNNRKLYFILGLITVLRSGSGLGLFSFVLLWLIRNFVEKKKKIRMRYLVISGIALVLAGIREISTYLLNPEAPRAILFRTGWQIAKDYFPIGTGFATFGSVGAAKAYSPLYYVYHLNTVWGLSEKKMSFLLDSFYPQIFAQFGFLGFMIWTAASVQIFYYLYKKTHRQKYSYCAILYLVVIWLTACIGFNSGSVWGCCVFSIIGLITVRGDCTESNTDFTNIAAKNTTK